MSTGTVVALVIGAGVIYLGRQFGVFCIPGIERPYGDMFKSCRNIKEVARKEEEEARKAIIRASVPLPSWINEENSLKWCGFDYIKLEHLFCPKG